VFSAGWGQDQGHGQKRIHWLTRWWDKKDLPAAIGINEFPQKEGAWEGSEQLPNQLAAFALAINSFLPPPDFVHREYAKPPVFRDGTLFSSFLYTIVQSTEVLKPNSWTYNFFEVSGHSLESS
jgi:hypothetical protein